MMPSKPRWMLRRGESRALPVADEARRTSGSGQNFGGSNCRSEILGTAPGYSRRDRRLKTCHRHVFLTPRRPPLQPFSVTHLSTGGDVGIAPYAINQRSPPVHRAAGHMGPALRRKPPLHSHCEKQRQFHEKFLRFAQKRLSCRSKKPRHNILCLGFFRRFRSETCVLFFFRSQENVGKTTVEPLSGQGNFSLQSPAILGILKITVGNCGGLIHIGGVKSHAFPQNAPEVVRT